MAAAILAAALLGFFFASDNESIEIKDTSHSTIVIARECDCDDDKDG